jgi:hypothetical protein
VKACATSGAGGFSCLGLDITTAISTVAAIAPTAAIVHDHRHADGAGSLAMRVRTRARNAGDGSTLRASRIS